MKLIKLAIVLFLSVWGNALYSQTILYQGGPPLRVGRTQPDVNFLWEYICNGSPCRSLIIQCNATPVLTLGGLTGPRSYDFPYYDIINLPRQGTSAYSSVFETYYPNVDGVASSWPLNIGTSSIRTVNYEVVSKRTIYDALGNTTGCNLNNTGTSYSFEKSLGTSTYQVVPFEWMLPDSVCSNSAPLNLTTFITANEGLTGATFSGPGVSGNIFNPATAGVGTWDIVATKQYGNGIATKTFRINVVKVPEPPSTGIIGGISCGPAKFTLTSYYSPFGDPLAHFWFNSPDSQTPFATGFTYITDTLRGSTTYYTKIKDNATGCFSPPHPVIVTINSPAEVTAGPDQDVCQNLDSLQLTGGFASEIGSGSWSSKVATVRDDFFYTSGLKPGSYEVTYSFINTKSCTGKASKKVNVLAGTVSAGADTTLCQGAGKYQLSGRKESPKGGNWSMANAAFASALRGDTLNTALLTPGSAYTVYYNTQGGNGCAGTDSMKVTRGIAPTPPTTIGGKVCGKSVVTLTGSGANATETYRWYTSQNDLIPVSPGSRVGTSSLFNTPALDSSKIYYVSKVDANGCEGGRSSVLATVNYPTPISAGNDLFLCKGTLSTYNLMRNASLRGGKFSSTATGVILNDSIFSVAAAAPGSYTVLYALNDKNGCLSTDLLTVNVVTGGAVSAGADTILCQGAGKYKLSGRKESPTGGTWSMADAAFSSALRGDTLNTALLTPGVSYTVNYTTQGTNGCSGTGTKKVTRGIAPTLPVLIGAKACGKGPVTLIASGATTNETYRWYETAISAERVSTTPQYTTSAITSSWTYYATKVDANGCESARASVLATINQPTPVNAGVDVTVCKNNSSYNLMRGVSLKGGKFSSKTAGVIENDTLFSVTAAALGSYNLIYSYTNSLGCISKDSLIFNVTGVALVSAGRDTFLCQGSGDYVLSGRGESPSGGTWRMADVLYEYTRRGDTLGTSSLKPGTTQVVNYTVSGVGGCTGTASKKVTAGANPFPPVTEVGVSCGKAALTYSARGAGPGETYKWYDSPTSQVVLGTSSKFTTPVLDSTKIYYTTITDVHGCEGGRRGLGAFIFYPAIVNAGPDISVCKASPSINLMRGASPKGGRFSSKTAGIVENDSIFNPAVASLGTYTILYTFMTEVGCFSTDSLKVDVKETVTVSAGRDTFLCQGSGDYVLSGRGESPSGGTWRMADVLYEYTRRGDTLGTSSLKPGTTLLVNYTVSSAGGCTGTASKKVTAGARPALPLLEVGNSCGRSVLTYTASGAGPGETYLWYDSPTSQVVLGTSAQFTTPVLDSSKVYYTTITDVNGCESGKRGLTAFIFHPTPVNAGADVSLCKNVPTYNLMGGASLKGGKFSSNASGLIQNDSIFDVSLASSGSYNLIYHYVNSVGCLSKDSIIVTITSNPMLVLNKDTSVCELGAPFKLRSNLVGGKWSGPGVDSNGTFSPSNYTGIPIKLSYSYNIGGCIADGVVNLSVRRRPPTPQIGGDSTACPGGYMTFFGTGIPATGLQYNWYKNNETSVFYTQDTLRVANTDLSRVLLEVKNSVSCSSLSRGEQKVTTSILDGDFTIQPNSIKKGEYAKLTSNIQFNKNDAPKSYDWDFGDSTGHDDTDSPYHYFMDTGSVTIRLKVVSIKGCVLQLTKVNLLNVIDVPINIKTDANGPMPDFGEPTSDNHIRFYPNPSIDGKFELFAYKELSFIHVDICNTTGLSILSKEYTNVRRQELDLVGLPSGAYICSLSDKSGGKKFFKLIKQ